MNASDLGASLKTTAICNTERPADAAAALLMAAGDILQATFGTGGAIEMMRTVIDAAERVILEGGGPARPSGEGA